MLSNIITTIDCLAAYKNKCKLLDFPNNIFFNIDILWFSPIFNRDIEKLFNIDISIYSD